LNLAKHNLKKGKKKRASFRQEGFFALNNKPVFLLVGFKKLKKKLLDFKKLEGEETSFLGFFVLEKKKRETNNNKEKEKKQLNDEKRKKQEGKKNCCC